MADRITVAAGIDCVSTGEVSRRVGLQVPTAVLRRLGFLPVVVTGVAVLWRESDMPQIRLKLIAMIAEDFE